MPASKGGWVRAALIAVALGLIASAIWDYSSASQPLVSGLRRAWAEFLGTGFPISAEVFYGGCGMTGLALAGMGLVRRKPRRQSA